MAFAASTALRGDLAPICVKMPKCIFHFLEFEGLDDRFEFFGKLACSRPFANRKRIATRAVQLRFCENKRNVAPRARRGGPMLIGTPGERAIAQGGSSSLMLDANSGGEAAFL